MTQENENFVDRKLFIPQEIHKIKLRKGETLVWGLDYEQYKNIRSEKVTELMKYVKENLEKQFPKNKIVVTLGKTQLSTIATEDENSSSD